MTNRGWILVLGGAVAAGGIYLAVQRRREREEVETDELAGSELPPELPPEVITRSPGVAPTLPEPAEGFPPNIVALYEKCRTGACAETEIAQLLSYLYSLASDPTLTAAERQWVSDVVIQVQRMPRVMGRHVGGCACKQRVEEHVGACCASCAAGGPCEECGAHDEEAA